MSTRHSAYAPDQQQLLFADVKVSYTSTSIIISDFQLLSLLVTATAKHIDDLLVIGS